jgi:hypothetical protein
MGRPSSHTCFIRESRDTYSRHTIRFRSSSTVALADGLNIPLSSYIITIYRATTLTGAVYSHRRSTHPFVGILSLRCYMKTHRIGSSDGAVRPSGLCYQSNAVPVAIHSAQIRCPSFVPRAGTPSAHSSSLFVLAAISRLSRRQPRPILHTINANGVRNSRRTFSAPGPSSPIFRHCEKPSAHSSIRANIHWHGHSHTSWSAPFQGGSTSM